MDHGTKQRARRSGTVKLTAFLAVLLFGLIALNAPITFASPADTQENATALAQTEGSSSVDEKTVADIAEEANPAVVTITNLREAQDPFTGREGDPMPYGVGSGYIIDQDGHVVTNNHVVEGGTEFSVQYFDGTTVDATLVGADPYQDVAVLKLDLAAGETVPATVSFADSSAVRAGDAVIAIGTPYGEFANSVSAGIANAVDRSLETGIGYALPNLIQHDAPIYSGNSGGPLLNLEGQVIGMNVAKASNPSLGYESDSGIGFAIAGNAVKELVDEIIATGKAARPYLGIRGEQTMDGQAVVSVEEDGPAAEAGLQPGDVITALEGESFDDDSFLNRLLFGQKAGDEVTLTVERDGEELAIDVTLGERPVATQ